MFPSVLGATYIEPGTGRDTTKKGTSPKPLLTTPAGLPPPHLPALETHPQKVDARNSCQNLAGEASEHCLALGYSQTAISVTCGGKYVEDDHCGTFLELHMGYANFYVDTEEVLSEVRLLTENVTVRRG